MSTEGPRPAKAAWAVALEVMEQALAEELARAGPEEVAAPADGNSGGAAAEMLARLEGRLAQLQASLARAESQSSEAGTLLDEAAAALADWRARVAEMGRRLADCTVRAIS